MRAKRVIKASLCDLFSLAFSTSERIFETVLSPKLFVVRTRMTPERLTQPEMTSSPTVASRGMLSPVRAMVFKAVLPSMITPSRGTFSPGRIRITEPTSTASGLTSCNSFLRPSGSKRAELERSPCLPVSSRCATSGLMSIRWAILSRLFPSA